MRNLSVVAFLAAFSSAAFAQDRVTIMTYNVGNFFDATDDPRIQNGENAEVINSLEWVTAKATVIARVISRFDQDKGPDVLLLTELESKQSLEAIKALLPNGSQYPTAILFDADPNRPHPKPDRRGIKVGLLSKLPTASGSPASASAIDLTAEAQCKDQDGAPGSTRDLLNVTLQLPDGSNLTVIGGHLPSGRNPRVCREIAASTIAKLAALVPQTHTIVAAGDFNFNCQAAEQKALRDSLVGWSIPRSLDNGCRHHGSHYFGRDKTWSFLDGIAQRASISKWSLDFRTFHVVQNDFEQFFWDQNDKVLRPKNFRFDASTGKGSGASDHWPVAVDLVKG